VIDSRDVTACIVTYGDRPEAIERIRDSLIFENVIVWDNSAEEHDYKVAGRYAATLLVETKAVYYQDDDVNVPASTQQALLDEYELGVMVANWAHGDNADGYDDVPLVGAGAIIDRELPWRALRQYLEHYPMDEAFMYEADYVAGVLYEHHKYVWLKFDIDMKIATDPSRLANQPWQRDLKFDITQRARAIRDRAKVAA
jgi:hypothetical protein